MTKSAQVDQLKSTAFWMSHWVWSFRFFLLMIPSWISNDFLDGKGTKTEQPQQLRIGNRDRSKIWQALRSLRTCTRTGGWRRTPVSIHRLGHHMVRTKSTLIRIAREHWRGSRYPGFRGGRGGTGTRGGAGGGRWGDIMSERDMGAH